MALRRHPRVHKMRLPAMFCSLQSTSLSPRVTLSKPSNHTFVNIITEVMNPVKGCNTEHSVVGYSPPLLLYTLDLRLTYLLGKLQVLGKGSDDSVSHARKTASSKRQRVTYQYAYDHRVVCKEGFLYLHSIGEKVLKNLQKHLKENGVTQREHGNKGRLPPNAFSFETVQDFIVNYATVFGLLQPAARRGRAGKAPIYLPASEGYNTVHGKYLEACLASGKQAAKYHSFRSIWLQCLPHIQFMTPRTDVCHYCEEYRC